MSDLVVGGIGRDMASSWIRAVLISMLTVAACQREQEHSSVLGGGAPLGAEFVEFRNGSRLSARRIEISGSEPVLLDIFDTKEQIECSFLNAADNKLRCLPEPVFGSVSYWFSDETCKSPVYEVAATQNLFKGATVAIEDPLVCEGTHRYAVKLFAAYHGKVFTTSDKHCVTASTTDLRNRKAFAIPVGERPASDWVGGEEVIKPSASRIQLREIHSSDGGRFSQGLVDAKLGTNCGPVLKGGDSTESVCWPSVTASNCGAFGDALCQTVPLASSFGTCESPRLMNADNEGFVSVGKPWAGPVYQWDGAQCVASSWEPQFFKFYEIGNKIEKAPFASLETKQVGSARLITMFAAEGGQLLVPTNDPSEARDSRLGMTCHFVRSPADEIRCLPDELFLQLEQPYFSDLDCSLPVMECDQCEGKEVALLDRSVYEEFPLTDIRKIESEASGIYYKRESIDGKQVCKGPFDVRDWRGVKGKPIPLPHLWKIGDATSWERFEQVFVRTNL